jgi:hypothetical protein
MDFSKGEETQIEAVSMTSKHKITLLLTLLLCYWHKDIFFIWLIICDLFRAYSAQKQFQQKIKLVQK